MFSREQKRQKVVLAAVDGLAVFLAFQLALAVRDPSGRMAARLDSAGLPMPYTGTILVTIWLVVFHAFDLYRFHKGGMDEVKSVINACATATALMVLLEFLAHLLVSRLVRASVLALSIWLVLGGRWSTRSLLRWFYTDPKISIPVVILGFNAFAYQLGARIAQDLSQYELLGFLDDEAPDGTAHAGSPVIGRPAELGALAEAHPGLELIMATPEAPPGSQEEIIRLCEVYRVQWRLVPAPYRSLRNGYRLEMIGGVPLIGPAACNIEGLNYVLKRGFDLLIASAALLLAMPLMSLVALLIWLIDGRPVLFHQVRIGIRGRHFELLKFRTMRADTDDQVHRAYVAQWIGHNGHAGTTDGRPIYKLVGDPHITRLGRFLRRTALDELPQLFNVLRGEMSLVGPRPALPYELEHYQDWHKRRLDALPGITGLWQVGGRNRLGFDEMVKLDLEYLRGWSLGADLRILLRTVPSVLGADGR